jgi:hypothetical protein
VSGLTSLVAIHLYSSKCSSVRRLVLALDLTFFIKLKVTLSDGYTDSVTEARFLISGNCFSLHMATQFSKNVREPERFGTLDVAHIKVIK